MLFKIDIFNCDEPNHLARNCPQNVQTETHLKQRGRGYHRGTGYQEEKIIDPEHI